MVAYFCHEILDNYHDYFQKTIAINENFLEILSRQIEKIYFGETLIIAIVFQTDHDSYHVCRGRNIATKKFSKIIMIVIIYVLAEICHHSIVMKNLCKFLSKAILLKRYPGPSSFPAMF